METFLYQTHYLKKSNHKRWKKLHPEDLKRFQPKGEEEDSEEEDSEE